MVTQTNTHIRPNIKTRTIKKQKYNKSKHDNDKSQQ